MTRTAIVGGETGHRGIFGGRRPKAESRLLMASLGLAVLVWLVFGGMRAILAGVGIYALAYVLTYPLPGGRSAVFSVLSRWRWWWRSRRNLAGYAPPTPPDAEPADTPAPATGRRPRPARVRAVPDGVGHVRVLSYPYPHGGTLAVLRHENPGQQPYLSAVLEVEGQPSGLVEEEDISAGAERFGRLLAACSGPTSLITGLQLITRVVPVDSAIHEWYILRNRSLVAPRQLFESYAELIGQARRSVEQHRNYIVARIPLAGPFFEVARDLSRGGVIDDEGRCRAVSDEMARLAMLASNASLQPVRLLSPRRLGALLRSLQDPDYFIDDLDGADLTTCWQPSRATRRYLLTNAKWATRTARVNPEAVGAEPVHMRWLSPLLIGVHPAVIRTMSVLIQFRPAHKARAEARRDVAEDRGRVAAAASEGLVTDGSDQSQMTASQQRLLDLRSGSGHAGVRWGMYVSVTAQQRAIRRACDLVADRAGDAGLANLAWLDGAHDLAQHFTWPLWRGLIPEKP